ncbi:hypothetical protein EV421DRAFT_1742581 [Armillaria borealis]|uniref:Uncharacterized protein n=1 Tax=Armillaria borealis TaxID=47425 RepID=A0AA39J066_9AGAR|nr:hypothetical protein EV421DRAFT_1742581 [Armillaria borealis]
MTSIVSVEVMAKEITTWVQRSLGIPSRNLDPSESFDIFYHIHIVNYNNLNGQFETLQKYQIRIVKHQQLTVNTHSQRNPLVQYLNDMGYDSHGSESSLSKLEESDSDDDFVESERSDSDDSIESKGSNLDHLSSGEEDTDVSAIVRPSGRTPQPGSQDPVLPVSQNSSALPIIKLKEWQSILRDILLNRHSTKPSEKDALLKFQDECTKIANIIHDMHQVHILDRQHGVWKSAVQESGLASVLEQISSPDFLPRSGNPHSEYLFRCFHLQEALGAILTNWTSHHIAEGWKEDEEWFQPHPHGSVIPPHGYIENSARLLMSALKKFPVLVPGMANPSLIFFLVSLECFLLSWHQWLRRSLEHLGFSTLKTDPVALFMDVKDYLKKNEGQLKFNDDQLCTIVHRTCELDQEKENYNVWLHQIQPGSRDKGKGHKTMQATTDKLKKTKKRKRARVPKMLEIKWQDIADTDIIGHGISLADPEDCMVPCETTMPIKCDPDIIKNCQGLTCLLVEKASMEPFTEAEECMPSIDHQSDEDGPIEEVAETLYWVRDSTGGSTLYHVILICSGIHTWFDIAMDNMYLREGARHADPALVKAMDFQTSEADHLGMTAKYDLWSYSWDHAVLLSSMGEKTMTSSLM